MVGQIYVTFNLEITSQSGKYAITTEQKILGNSGNTFVLYDDFFSENLIHDLLPESQKIAIKINEKNKSLSMAERIIEKMVMAKCNKDTHLIAIGGGAIQDLATVVASLYMRGIKWSYVPTTLMSMLDSCIGGKSSINVGNYKNIVGNIYPPEHIYVTSKFTKTLSKLEIASGLAEAGKICFAKSEDCFNEFLLLLRSKIDSDLTYEKLAEVSLGAKKWFIEVDEFDKKERKLLNFGHTFGHALEAATNFKVPHGVAILIGMKAALKFAATQNENLEQFVSETFDPIKAEIGKVSLNKKLFDSAISSDKKHNSDQMFFVLPDEAGNLSLAGFERSNDLLEKCWQSLVNSLQDLGAEYEVL
jgi:3-dehydroquinate synthase